MKLTPQETLELNNLYKIYNTTQTEGWPLVMEYLENQEKAARSHFKKAEATDLKTIALTQSLFSLVDQFKFKFGKDLIARIDLLENKEAVYKNSGRVF